MNLQENENGINPQDFKKKEGIYKFLDFSPRTADELLKQMRKAGKNVELSEVLSELILLCMEGKARQEAGCYVRIG